MKGELWFIFLLDVVIRGARLKIGILGIGAIGGVLVGALSKTESEIICVSRSNTAKLLSSGLVINTPEGEIEFVNHGRYEVIDSEKRPISKNYFKTCDFSIIAGKTYSTFELASVARDITKEDGYIISIQNGLGNREIISRLVGKDRTIGGSITHSSWRSTEGEINWTGRGSMNLGMTSKNQNEKIISLIEILNLAGLNAHWSEDIDKILWKKLFINIAINPICAITGLKNGALLYNPELLSQAIEAMGEALAVAQSYGLNFEDLDLEKNLIEIIENTSENRVSMLQDIMAGRKTEIDSLCGEIISRGRILGIPTPKNEILYALIKGIESSQILD